MPIKFSKHPLSELREVIEEDIETIIKSNLPKGLKPVAVSILLMKVLKISMKYQLLFASLDASRIEKFFHENSIGEYELSEEGEEES